MEVEFRLFKLWSSAKTSGAFLTTSELVLVDKAWQVVPNLLRHFKLQKTPLTSSFEKAETSRTVCCCAETLRTRSFVPTLDDITKHVYPAHMFHNGLN